MARLDRFLQALQTHGGDGLVLAAGHPVRMRHRSGQLKPVTREILEEAQVASLIRELAPPAMAALLESAGPALLHLPGTHGARGRGARTGQRGQWRHAGLPGRAVAGRARPPPLP